MAMKEFIGTLGNGPFPDTDQGKIQLVVFVSTFGLIAKIVASDDDINQKELVLIEQLMTETMKLDSAKRKFASKVFNETRKAEVSIDDLVKAYKNVLSDKPKMYEWLLDILVRISLADEVLKDEETEFLNEVAKCFGFESKKLDEVKNRYQKESSKGDNSNNEILGIKGNESLEEIQDRYNKKMKQFDVTKLIADGFSNELVELAMKKQAEFTNAFMEIRKTSK